MSKGAMPGDLACKKKLDCENIRHYNRITLERLSGNVIPAKTPENASGNSVRVQEIRKALFCNMRLLTDNINLSLSY